MAIHYTGENKLVLLGTKWDFKQAMWVDLYMTMRRWGFLLIEAMPRYGKSALAKNIVVQISKFRKIIIFDYNNEWINNITRYNMDSPYPDKLVGYKILKDFTFNLLDFTNESDFVSLGFSDIQARIVCSIIKDSAHMHKGVISEVDLILSAIPTNEYKYKAYNEKYGTHLLTKINDATKTSIITRWSTIKEYFWLGPTDQRVIYDFEKEISENDHLIVSLFFKNSEVSTNLARAYTGKLMEKMKDTWEKYKPFVIVEESSALFPNYTSEIQLSSNLQMYNLVSRCPKLGVSVMLLCQHQNQLYVRLLENVHQRITGIVQKPTAEPQYEVKLEYDPERNIREFIYMDVGCTPNNFRYDVFRPAIPCTEFESNR